MMEKTCEICGKTFMAARGNHKYCSAECSAKGKTVKDKEFHQKKKQLIRERLVERICPICGTTFKPRSERQQCCCKPCTNYRCTSCWRKRAQKYGIPEEDVPGVRWYEQEVE